jgi:hypothetical protein
LPDGGHAETKRILLTGFPTDKKTSGSGLFRVQRAMAEAVIGGTRYDFTARALILGEDGLRFIFTFIELRDEALTDRFSTVCDLNETSSASIVSITRSWALSRQSIAVVV